LQYNYLLIKTESLVIDSVESVTKGNIDRIITINSNAINQFSSLIRINPDSTGVLLILDVGQVLVTSFTVSIEFNIILEHLRKDPPNKLRFIILIDHIHSKHREICFIVNTSNLIPQPIKRKLLTFYITVFPRGFTVHGVRSELECLTGILPHYFNWIICCQRIVEEKVLCCPCPYLFPPILGIIRAPRVIKIIIYVLNIKRLKYRFQVVYVP